MTTTMITTVAWWWTYSMKSPGTIVYNVLYDGSMIAKVIEWMFAGLILAGPALMILFSVIIRGVAEIDDKGGDGK